MSLVSDEAFVLDAFPYGERDLVAVLFAKAHGLVRASARGARARLSRFGGALQTMNEVTASWVASEGRELVSLREARSVRELFAAAGLDPAAGAVAAYVADHLKCFAPEHEENAPLWRMAVHVRNALADGIPPLLVARYTEVWTLRIAGVFPRFDVCGLCGETLDLPIDGDGARRDSAGHFLCSNCGRSGTDFPKDAGRALKAIRERPLDQLVPLAGATEELAVIEGLCRDLRRGFLGKELVSYGVVKQMLR